MTNNKAWLSTLAIIVAVAVTLYFFPSDKKKITDNLDKLAKYCTSTQAETAFDTLRKARSLAQLCTDPCLVKMQTLKIDSHLSRSEIRDHMLMVKKRLPEMTCSFHDTTIEITAANRAAVITTLKVVGNEASGSFIEAYEMDIILSKKKNDWYFNSFTEVEFLQK